MQHPEESSPQEDDSSFLVGRLREVVESIGSQPAAARVAQISVRSLRSYLSGEAPPSVKALGNLAFATNFSLDWIVTGKGEKRRDKSKPADPRDKPLDAGLDEGACTSKMLRKLQEIPELYKGIGIGFANEDEEDDVVGEVIDAIQASASSPYQWEQLAEMAVKCHRIAIAYVIRERHRLKPSAAKLQNAADSVARPKGR